MPLPSIIDSHAHLQFEHYAADLKDVLGRARDAGVETIVTVGTDLGSSRAAVELAGRDPAIYATVGIHPHDAAALTPDVMTELAQLARRQKVVAIGETGLDFYYNHALRNAQLTAFREQLQLAKTLHLPVVIHSREAKEETLRLLQEVTPGITGVLHCFTGDIDMARRAIGLGFYISFSGIITFANAGPLRNVAKEVPLEHLMIETDCPFLAPTPYRGKRNEPAWVARVAEEIAALKPSVTLDQIRSATCRNTAKLFKLSLT